MITVLATAGGCQMLAAGASCNRRHVFLSLAKHRVQASATQSIAKCLVRKFMWEAPQTRRKIYAQEADIDFGCRRDGCDDTACGGPGTARRRAGRRAADDQAGRRLRLRRPTNVERRQAQAAAAELAVAHLQFQRRPARRSQPVVRWPGAGP